MFHKLAAAVLGAVSLAAVSFATVLPAHAAPDTLQFGVGLFQPDKEKNDAT